MHGLDLRCRKADCITVADKTDLSDPAKSFSHKKEFLSVSHVLKAELLTNHIPVPACIFPDAAL